MRQEVAEAIQKANLNRAKVLEDLNPEQRTSSLESLFKDYYIDQHLTLQKWAALTGQSAQIDTGYMAQFIASIILGIPGQGFRGKGDDLIDGSEVKSAANISGVDRPRWNHNLGTLAHDASRRKKDLPTAWEQYLACPTIVYILVDRVATPQPSTPRDIRIRTWCVDAQNDTAWRDLLQVYVENREGNRYNYQLHPPVGYDDDVVVNTLGNLDFGEVLVLDARVRLAADPEASTITWTKRPTFPVTPILGRVKPRPYGETARPSNLMGSVDVVPDTGTLPGLFPDILSEEIEHRIRKSANQESATDAL